MRGFFDTATWAGATTLVLVLSACAPQNKSSDYLFSGSADSAIVGGTAVADNDAIAASTVGLASENMGVFCTGSLIASNVIITAAHCAIATDEPMQVTFGTVESTQQKRNVLKGIITKAYANHLQKEQDAQGDREKMMAAAMEKNQGDIALFIFEGNAPAGFRAADIVAKQSQLTKDASVTLAGFGATTMTPFPSSPGKLLKANVKLSDPTYSETEVLFKQDQGRGACHGDSGGPAFLNVNGKVLLFGVTSRSATLSGGSTCLEGSIYTNIVSHMAWIRSAVQQLRAAIKPKK